MDTLKSSAAAPSTKDPRARRLVVLEERYAHEIIPLDEREELFSRILRLRRKIRIAS